MKYLTLEEIKAHTRIDMDVEDNLLEMYGESAEESVMNYLGKTLEDFEVETEDEEGETHTELHIPTPIRHATMMLAAHFYAHREPAGTVNVQAIPYTMEVLLNPYKTL